MSHFEGMYIFIFELDVEEISRIKFKYNAQTSQQ
jgi:hypothetical protein